MESLPLFLVMFATIGLVAFAALLLIRDLVLTPADAVDQRLIEQSGGTGGIQRLSRTRDEPPRSITERIDAFFDRLVYEGGFLFTPQVAFLMALAAGLLIGGGLFVWLENPLLALAGMVGGFAVVIGIYMFLRTRRLRAMQQQLPEVLNSIARSVRAGQTLEQAVHDVGERGAEPLALEFRRCARQLDMGLSMEATMRALARRAPLFETRIFASTVMVQRQTGGSLPLILDRLAKVIRDRLNFRRQYRAATAAGRLATIIICLAAPVAFLFLWIFAPDFIAPFFQERLGRLLLATAIVLQVVGVIIVFLLTRVRY